MKPILSNFGFDFPNLNYLSFDLAWRKGGKKRVCIEWQTGLERAFTLTLKELLEDMTCASIGPRVAKDLCNYHGQEILSQIREWLDREGRNTALEVQKEREKKQLLQEQRKKLADVRKLMLRLIEIGTDPEELHEMVRQVSVESVHNS